MTAGGDKEPKAGKAVAGTAGQPEGAAGADAGAAAADDQKAGGGAGSVEYGEVDLGGADGEGDGGSAGEAAAVADAEAVADAAADADAAASADATDDVDAAGSEAADGGDAAPGAQNDLLRAAREKAAELQDRYARLQAEWDNFRKRTNAERDSERVRAAESLVKDLLPVLDDLERALKHAKDSGEGGTLTDGVEAVQTKFLQILGKHNVSQVEADAQPFDAMCHQAVGTTEDASVPEETVVQVYQQGYRMGDKVIRPAMVVTSTGGPAREAEDDGAAQDDDAAGEAPGGGADAALADDGGQEG